MTLLIKNRQGGEIFFLSYIVKVQPLKKISVASGIDTDQKKRIDSKNKGYICIYKGGIWNQGKWLINEAVSSGQMSCFLEKNRSLKSPTPHI